jgi:hypothetical protein
MPGVANLIACKACGHHNLPSYASCSNCGQPLTGAGGDAQLAQLVASREAAARRKVAIMAVVGVAVVGGVGYKMFADSQRKSQAQAKLDWLDGWLALDKREVGGFWNCVTQSNTPVDAFGNANQVQAKIEVAYATQPKTFAEFIKTECVAKAEIAERSFAAMTEVPAEFTAQLAKFRGTVAGLRSGIENYAERLGQRGETKDLASLIQEAGDTWHSSYTPTPEGVAFDKFLTCAVPGLSRMKDAQALLEYLADQCFKRDAGTFMETVRETCSEILAKIDPAAKPSAGYKATMKKFYEEERRMMSAWESCATRGRKGSKDSDLAQFFHAFGEYMQARAEMGKIAQAIRDAV